jgi:hypothetical protein
LQKICPTCRSKLPGKFESNCHRLFIGAFAQSAGPA